ncbi:threonine--tRNA ligase [Thalassoroseus pseudoceratinae]|uniref:threonine--tRNA ligase n=1 Tax=Thalassoroseus pseudoceratinae TaxID=2713176 RepID=UPI001422F1BA
MVSVLLPDGTQKDYPAGSSAIDVAASIGSRLANDVVAAEVNGTVVDAMRPLEDVAGDDAPINLTLLTKKNRGDRAAELDEAALAVMRHSCAHVMARAVMRLYEGVGLAFGPTVGNRFYYDFDLKQRISEDDFPAIEAEMKKIIKEAEEFSRFSLSRDEALKLCQDLNQELKCEHIETGLAEHGDLSFYRQGEFVDLCRGPHIPDAGRIKAFKLLSVAGSYWKGDADNKQLQRLYGTAYFDKKDLKAYLEKFEEAKKRDHRVLGKKLNLFSISNDVGQGLCLWQPKGATIRALLEDFIKRELLARGYEPVYSPHIGRVELYEISGHFPYYRESQFAPIFQHPAGQLVDGWIEHLTKLKEPDQDPKSQKIGPELSEFEQKMFDAAGALGVPMEQLNVYRSRVALQGRIELLKLWEKQQERYLLKPMNCPHHVQMYKAQPRSYRDLPVRLAEFGTVYRHEQSGELNGMLRVRGLTQDDAHLFCTPDQVEEEFRETLGLVKFVLNSVGLDDYRVQLSKRDPNSDKYVGGDELWDQAEGVLKKVLSESGLEFSECEGEAAFYGPKADFMVRDCLGREWQLGTVQLDYNLPERFELEYIGTDNRPHRPVMIHRAPFGSMERFVGMLIEHFAGAFPLWLAPEQIRVLPLSDKSLDYAKEVEKKVRAAGFRVNVDSSSSKVQAKIREAQLDLIPYMLVVGPKEAESGQVAVRDRIDGDLGAMALEDAITKLKKEVDDRVVRQVVKSDFAHLETEGEAQNEY